MARGQPVAIEGRAVIIAPRGRFDPWFSLYSGKQLSSTKPIAATTPAPSWRDAGLLYHGYRYHLQRLFGTRVQKVSLDAGFTCPNVDGTVAKGGCTFCDNRSFSPSRRLPRADIRGQIEQSLARMQRRYADCTHFIAYFQPATNTYAPVERLRGLYLQALEHPQVVGLAIGTRPDCVGDDVLELIDELARRVYVSVEYGMQTIHDRSLDWMNRGCHHDAMVDAMERSRQRRFEISTHVILGLPGESRDDMLATARELNRLEVDAVKLHNLYCVKNTRLADQVATGEVELMGREEYVATVVEFLEILSPEIVVERLTGDAPPQFFIGPEWSLDKGGVKRQIEAELVRRGTYQGARYEPEGEP